MITTQQLKSLLSTLILAFLALINVNAQKLDNTMEREKPIEVAFIMFDDYETLDVFGPAEIFGRLVDLYSLKFYSLEGGVVTNRHKVPIMTEKFETMGNGPKIILVPGGMGTRKEVNNPQLLDKIEELSQTSDLSFPFVQAAHFSPSLDYWMAKTLLPTSGHFHELFLKIRRLIETKKRGGKSMANTTPLRA